MKTFKLLTTLLLMLAFTGCCNRKELRKVEDFNFDWNFILADSEAFADESFDHSQWRALRLPHDWSIEGNFSADNPSTASGGALPGGIGWYRKSFVANYLPDQLVNIEFDGVFMNSTVYINGHEVGHRPYGYSSFCYDITPYLNPTGATNAIAVRCDNSEQPNSRWYAGCGIYRNVRLVTKSRLSVDYSGTYITTPQVSAERATIDIEVTLANNFDTPQSGTIENIVRDPDGQPIATASSPFTIEANATAPFTCQTTLQNPQLWDVDSPKLYTVETVVKNDSKATDSYLTKIGIRSFSFDSDKGFILNGRNLKLKGVCMHHDMGALGTAVHRRAIERQIEILKQMGCNSIRTSHNPPAPELLELCDSMGIVVMDEAFDMWRKRKTQYDYARYFDEWHERDLSDFMRRDRNHACVMIWSTGNEILEQWNSDDDSGLLSAEAANLLMNFRDKLPQDVSDRDNPNMLLTVHLTDIMRRMDPTRPITAGCNESRPTNNLLRTGAFDIVGYNYHQWDYDSMRVWFPNKAYIGSETVSSVQSRGFYLNPSSEQHVQPSEWWLQYDTPHHQCSAYDHSRVPWGDFHESSWLDIRDRDFLAGTYIWTGFDYLGEPTPYTFPSRSSYFGIVDLCGFPKDIYYFYCAEWTDNPTLHIVPSNWNWKEGDKIDVWAYYNNADSVELLLNDRSLGSRAKSDSCLHCLWQAVPFEKGVLKAVAYKDGKQVMTDQQTTPAGDQATALQLTVDRPTIKADGYDLAYVTIDGMDKNGVWVPTAQNMLSMKVEGEGELVGVDNGNAAGSLCLKGDRMPLFNGKALAIVRSKRGCKGDIRLTVEGEGFNASATIKAE